MIGNAWSCMVMYGHLWSGIVDVYHGFWDEVGNEKMKTWERESAERRVYLRNKHSVMEQRARRSVFLNGHEKSNAGKIGNISDLGNKVSL